MDVFKHRMVAAFCTAFAILLIAETIAPAEPNEVLCELTIHGDSIRRLTLIERHGAGQAFESPGATVKLPAGEYRVEAVTIEGGYELSPLESFRQEWFRVTEKGPNELSVGAPLYPTVTTRRHGGFIQMDYDVVDGAGRNYQREFTEKMPPAPTYTVFSDGKQIGSGSFEYG